MWYTDMDYSALTRKTILTQLSWINLEDITLNEISHYSTSHEVPRQKEEWWLPGKGEIFNGYRMGTHLQDEEFLRLAVQQCKGTWQYGAIHN